MPPSSIKVTEMLPENSESVKSVEENCTVNAAKQKTSSNQLNLYVWSTGVLLTKSLTASLLIINYMVNKEAITFNLIYHYTVY